MRVEPFVFCTSEHQEMWLLYNAQSRFLFSACQKMPESELSIYVMRGRRSGTGE